MSFNRFLRYKLIYFVPLINQSFQITIRSYQKYTITDRIIENPHSVGMNQVPVSSMANGVSWQYRNFLPNNLQTSFLIFIFVAKSNNVEPLKNRNAYGLR